ncbi:transposase [Liquorilactobacillus mali]|uniref:transposase n=1 Tax=Liquorilactobacillus mali TaxID=1618 RepID=UPI0029554313|nr:transposase [Liquorilactobacillus mali]
MIISIPGAGEISTTLLLGFTGKMKRFSSYKQIGIDLCRIQFGGFRKVDWINRRGQNDARYIMFEMIRGMLRNKVWIDNRIVDYYYKLKKRPRPKPDMVAITYCV